jgi:hypothetical protein
MIRSFLQLFDIWKKKILPILIMELSSSNYPQQHVIVRTYGHSHHIVNCDEPETPET